MKLSRVLPGLFLLLVQPVVSRIAPFDPDDNVRPDNVTGLDYKYYDKIGSYYNGTLTLKISPVYNPSPGLRNGEACQEFENKTFEIPLKAIAGFQEVAPKARSVNPFFLNINAWDPAYNLSKQYETANYSEYQEFLLNTNNYSQDNATYVFNLTNNDTSTWYNFAGHMDQYAIPWESFKFNVSGICDETYAEDMIFSASFPQVDDRIDYDWMDTPVSVPVIQGGFTPQQASMNLEGLFTATSDFTELVGKIRIEFEGLIDPDRSDQLLMGQKKPAWNATMGFSVATVDYVDTSPARSVYEGLGSRIWVSSYILLGLSLLFIVG